MAIARLYLTGGLAVEHAGGVVTTGQMSTRQAQLLLAALAWHPGTAVERHELMSVLWPAEPPRSATTAIATVISALRTTLEPAGLAITAEWAAYTLTDAEGATPWVDVEAARRAVHRAESHLRAGRMREVYASSGVVTSITRRPLLAGIDGPWVDDRRDELRELRARGLRCAVRFCSWNGEHEAAVAYARTLVDLDPLRERSQRMLMETQLAAGDRASALRSFDRLRRLLADELGVDPDADTLALHRRLLD